MQKLSKNSKLTSKNYDWEIIGKKHIDLIKKMFLSLPYKHK